MPEWVAVIGDSNIIATGKTEEECIENAKGEGYEREYFSVMPGAVFFS